MLRNFDSNRAITKAIIEALGIDHATLSNILTDDHHTKYTNIEAVAAAEAENPFDHAGDVNVASGKITLQKLHLKAATELTLDTDGAITVTQSWHKVDTFEDATPDDLEVINGGSEGMMLILRAANSARTVNVTEAGNCVLAGGPFALDHVRDQIMLIYSVAHGWAELSRSDNN